MEGFLNHTDKVATFYEERRDIIMESADRWLSGKASVIIFQFSVHRRQIFLR